MFKIIGIIMIIFYEIFNLYCHGIIKHPWLWDFESNIFKYDTFVFLILKYNMLLKIKEKMPQIIKTATKIFLTTIKSTEKNK